MAVGYLAGSPVVSVNGDAGPAVSLDAAEVGADATGAAAAAQSAAQSFATTAANNALTAANANTTAAVAAALASIAPGAWVGVGLVANGLVELAAAWSADVSGTYFPVNFRQGAYGRLEASGRLNTTTNYTAGQTIFTLPAALCPAKSLVFDVRIGGVGAAAAFLTITSGGVASLSASFTAGAGSWLQLDPISGRRAT